MITDLPALQKKDVDKEKMSVVMFVHVCVFGISQATSRWPCGASAYLRGIRGTQESVCPLVFLFLSGTGSTLIKPQVWAQVMTFVSGHMMKMKEEWFI